MRQKSRPVETAEQHVRDIRRATHRRYTAEDKIRIVLSALRGEHAIAELCRRGRYRREHVLQLLEGVSGSWQPTRPTARAGTQWPHTDGLFNVTKCLQIDG